MSRGSVLRVAIAILFCTILASPRCSLAQTAAGQPSVTGTISYRERTTLPPDAAIDVKVVDASAPAGTPKTVGESIFAPEGKQVPIPFQLSYNPADINPAHKYELQANISVKGKLMFASTTPYPVLTQGAPSQVNAVLQQAPAQPPTASGAKLRDTEWRLVELNGTPIQAAQGEGAHMFLNKKGALSGFSGCNTLVGSYIAEQGALQFTPAAATQKFCSTALMEQEQAFFAALKATTNYGIDGNMLELLNGSQVLAKFQTNAK